MTTSVTAAEKPGRLRRWLPFFYVFIGFVLFCFASFGYWYNNDNDLIAVDERAKELDQPTTWEEINLEITQSERRLLWSQISSLHATLPSFRETNTSGTISKFDPWSSLPTELGDHHNKLDRTKIAELIDLLTQLGDEPLILHDKISFNTKLDELPTLRWLAEFQNEQLALAQERNVGLWSRLLLAQYRRTSAPCFILQMTRTSLLNQSLRIIARRLPDIKQYDPDIADELQRVTAQMKHDVALAFQGEFVSVRSVLTKSRDLSGTGLNQFTLRLGRGPALMYYLDFFELYLKNDTPTVLRWIEKDEAELSKSHQSFWGLSVRLRGILTPSVKFLVKDQASAELYCHLLAAEIRGNAWPVDSMDPLHGQLKSITEGDKVIAGYSVGTDGIDQGGSEHRDIVFPLYAKPPPAIIPSETPTTHDLSKP